MEHLIVVLTLFPITTAQRRLPMNPDLWTEAHNKYRRLENATGMMEMVWNVNLERLALAYAQQCDFSHTTLQARTNKDDFRYIGENLFAIRAKLDVPSSAEEVVGQSWVRDERPDYDFTSNVCTGDKPCGHYTQVVWATTCAVGCALTRCKDIINAPIKGDAYLAVCLYGPACEYFPCEQREEREDNRGNVEGQRPFKLGNRCSEPGCQCQLHNGGLCAGTCKEKGRQLTPQDAPIKAANPGCANQHQLCVAWSLEGKCRTEKAYMQRFCKASCDPACADQKPPNFCVDKDFVLCGFLASRGYCAGNTAIMASQSVRGQWVELERKRQAQSSESEAREQDDPCLCCPGRWWNTKASPPNSLAHPPPSVAPAHSYHSLI